MPELREPVRLDTLNTAIGATTHLIFCDEDGFDQNGLTQLTDKQIKKIALLIGPEGGFSEQERISLMNRENTIVLGLGPRILRADTAAVAALAVIQAAIGDWYRN